MNQFHRRLSAVLALDAAGYSRLVESNEEDTHQRMRLIFGTVVEPRVAEAGGRIVKTAGDGALIEFASAVDAIRCAMRIQDDNEASQRGLPAEQRIRFRMGINLGDVIVEPDDIHGGGVNIAARLEALATAGEIIVSEPTMQVANQADYAFTDLGPHQLKNVTHPVRLYRVVRSHEGFGEPAQGKSVASTIAGFGPRPVIAVIPFRNRSTDPAQAFFADAITEDIITMLAKWRSFPVISSASAFAYKGRDADAKTIGRELGVRYLVHGSLRKQGSQVRIIAQLMNAETEDQLVVEHYDCRIEDSFTIQDEIVRSIVGALAPELVKQEGRRSVKPAQLNVDTYECFHKGLWHHYRYTKEDSKTAQEYFRRALAIDPDHVQSAAALAVTLCHAIHAGWETDKRNHHEAAFAHARHAVRIDPRDPNARFALSTLYRHTGQRQVAEIELRETIRLNPSHAGAHANLAFVHNYFDRPHEALAEAKLALRLSPHDPRRFIWLQALLQGHYLLGQYKAALAAGQEGLAFKPDYLVPYRFVLAAMGQLGRVAEARAIIPLVRRLDGGHVETEAQMRLLFVDSAAERIVEGLRKAGYG